MNEAAIRYREQGHVYLAQAREEFVDDDLMQASEKAWGAAAQLAKAAGEERGWRHHSHGSLFEIVRRLAEETEDEVLGTDFDAAGTLRANFYEGFLSSAGIETRLRNVARFIERVESVLNGASENGAAG